LLKRALDGHGTVVGVVGSPGIGKSRLVREVSAMADAHDVDVFTAFCESHPSQVPFHAVAREHMEDSSDAIEIVLIGSDSLETVKVTHANYFDGTVAASKYFIGI
jgi:predicted ATPase